MDSQIEAYDIYDVIHATRSSPYFPRLYSIIRAPIRTAGIRYFLRPYQPYRPHLTLRFGIEEFPYDLLVTMKIDSRTPSEVPGILSIILSDQAVSPDLDVEFGINGKHTLLEILEVLRGISSILPDHLCSDLSQFSFREEQTLEVVGLTDWM